MSSQININTGPVTTLAPTDLIVGTTSDGATLKPISLDNLKKLIRDDLQIGGRNLIMNSRTFGGWSSKTGGTIIDGSYGILTVRKALSGFKGSYKIYEFQEGEYYTFSIYTDSEECSIYLAYSPDANIAGLTTTATFTAQIKSSRVIGAGWFQKIVTAKCTKAGQAALEFESLTSVAVRFCAPKLERGNIATDWSPAPEDLGFVGGGYNELSICNLHPLTQISPLQSSVQIRPLQSSVKRSALHRTERRAA